MSNAQIETIEHDAVVELTRVVADVVKSLHLGTGQTARTGRPEASDIEEETEHWWSCGDS